MTPDEAAALSMIDPSLGSPSILSLLLGAPLVVQIVIAALLIVLIWSVVVIAEKLFHFSKARKETDKFEQVFWSGQSLDELYQALSQRRNDGMAGLFVAAMREWKRSTERENGEAASRPMPGVQLRVEKVMDVSLSRDVDRLERRLAILAAIAATAPLVGLFGLAWGLMAALQTASAPATASLAAVAPGVAQGLLALAVGLFTAIPAKIFSKKFEAEAAQHASRLDGFADEFSAILSRQFDRAG